MKNELDDVTGDGKNFSPISYIKNIFIYEWNIITELFKISMSVHAWL